MTGTMLKSDKRKYGIDLVIIGLTSLAVYSVMGIFYMLLNIDTGGLPLLVQTLIVALFEFGSMGLGITIICVLRKESFASFGLKKEKLLLTVLLSALVCLPELLYIVYQNGGFTYLPFQGVNFTRSVLVSGFPVNVIGMLIIITSWGFFEGFTYVVISDRINKILPPKNLFFNWGAIICSIFCLLIHIMVGHTYGFDALTTFILIYGMLVVYRYTGNAWGCVFIYCFYWNAIGLK